MNKKYSIDIVKFQAVMKDKKKKKLAIKRS